MRSCDTILRTESIVSRVVTSWLLILNLKAEASNMKGVESYWNQILRLRVPPKIKYFLWRANHSWLPTNSVLFYRKIYPNPRVKKDNKWLPPEMGVWKVNVNAGVDTVGGCCSAGVVIRNHEGQVLCSSAGYSARPLSVLSAELAAVISGLKLVAAGGLKKIQLASDCLNAISLINNSKKGIFDADNLLVEVSILKCSFDRAEFCFECRDSNLLAHRLAKLALVSKASASWNGVEPLVARHLAEINKPSPV
ncbi:hypothetical protein G4B88_019495 [Cannabis sativa]|uniref:RNase H type-1 domain-containing protein n=1 Tax=Cannabis sativa TaxID=3483 RepID=A0A7J6HYQ8_CANSA|nr:hypothetical protein G4B88_019495 [Cannabis sativa]